MKPRLGHSLLVGQYAKYIMNSLRCISSFIFLAGCIFLNIDFIFSANAHGITNTKSDILVDSGNNKKRLLDRSHEFIIKKIYGPVKWFDNFFTDKRLIEEGLPYTFVRWQNDALLSEGGENLFRSRVHANIRMSKAEKMFKFLLIGEDREVAFEILPDRVVDPELVDEKKQEHLNLGLRLNLIKKLKSKLYIHTGVRFEYPPDPYVKLSYQYIYPIGTRSLARFTETNLWKNSKGLSETLRIDLERLFDIQNMLRWCSFCTHSQSTGGLNWGTDLSFLHQISPKAAIKYSIGEYGITRPHVTVENYGVTIRFRRSFYREWIFYELKPGVSWLRNRNWDSVESFIIRFELQFDSTLCDSNR